MGRRGWMKPGLYWSRSSGCRVNSGKIQARDGEQNGSFWNWSQQWGKTLRSDLGLEKWWWNLRFSCFKAAPFHCPAAGAAGLVAK